MISTELLLGILSLFVAICTGLVAYSTYQNNKRKDAGKDKAEEAAMSTKLDFIGNDIKDIKAEYRRTTNELHEVRRIAEHASERADAAHKRLDRAHIDVRD